jgi:glycosyltransferase involved in cell wall biosynthesis
MKLVIQIPCYNEALTIKETLAELPKEIPGVDKIIVLLVDDGSTDETDRIGLENGADFVIRHPYNRGLAKTFMTGIQTSLALGADIIVNTDGDNQYPGRYISELVKPILEDRACIVIGDRQVDQNQHFSPIKRRLESLGSWLMRVISKTNVSDAPSGFRAYSRFAALHLQVYNQYSYTLETLIQAGKEHIAITQIPIKTNPATRPSRLHKGLLNFIWRQSGTILRSYVLYQPLKTFTQVSVPFLLTSVILLGRFLILYLMNQTGIGRYTQSVSIGGTLGIFGILLFMIGLIGDAVRTNRQAMEEILAFQRNSQHIDEDSREFIGCKLINH